MRIDFLRSVGRFFVQVDIGNPKLGSRIAIGRWPKGETLAKLSDYRTRMVDEYGADDAFPAHLNDPDAHNGNIVSPVGAQSFQAYDAHPGAWIDGIGDPDAMGRQAKNWVDQERDGS